MRQVWRIFNLVAAGLLVCGVAGLAGVAAALSDWNWWSASSKSITALSNGAALSAALGWYRVFAQCDVRMTSAAGAPVL